jgi:hypothetical protein
MLCSSSRCGSRQVCVTLQVKPHCAVPVQQLDGARAAATFCPLLPIAASRPGEVGALVIDGVTMDLEARRERLNWLGVAFGPSYAGCGNETGTQHCGHNKTLAGSHLPPPPASDNALRCPSRATNRVICPTGARQNILSSLKRKNILIFRISDSPYGPVPRPSQGASRDRRERGAECGGRVGAVRRAASARTAKSCGPGALRLGAQGVARLQRRRGDDGGNSAQFTGERV